VREGDVLNLFIVYQEAKERSY